MAVGKITVATIRAARAAKVLRKIRKLHKSVESAKSVAKAKRAEASIKAFDAKTAREFTQAVRTKEMVATEKFRQTNVLANVARQDFVRMDQVLTHTHGKDIPQAARLALEAEGKAATDAAKVAADAQAELLAVQKEVRAATQLENAAQGDAVLADQVSVEADLVLRDVEKEFANTIRGRGSLAGLAMGAMSGDAQAAEQLNSISAGDMGWELFSLATATPTDKAEDFLLQHVVVPVIVGTMEHVVDPAIEEVTAPVVAVAAAVEAKASLDEAFGNEDEAQIERSLVRSNSKEVVWNQAAGAPLLNPTSNTPGVQLP